MTCMCTYTGHSVYSLETSCDDWMLVVLNVCIISIWSLFFITSAISSEVAPSSYSSPLAVSNTTPSTGVSSTSLLSLKLESTPSVPTKNMSSIGDSITFSQIVTATPTTVSSSLVSEQSYWLDLLSVFLH